MSMRRFDNYFEPIVYGGNNIFCPDSYILFRNINYFSFKKREFLSFSFNNFFVMQKSETRNFPKILEKSKA